MRKGRLAAGAGATVLAVCAIAQLKPESRLTSESFVSAFFTNTPGVGITGAADEIAKLPACKFNSVAQMGNAQVASTTFELLTYIDTNGKMTAFGSELDDVYGDTGKEYYTTDAACICGKYASTRGRVCEASGNANPQGQSYLPRCPPLGKDVYPSYSAGCWCGSDDDFTSVNTDKALGSGDVTVTGSVAPTDADPVVKVEAAECKSAGGPSGVICLKGEKCTSVNADRGYECTKPDGSVVNRRITKYAWMIPKIEPNSKVDKFTICRSTNMQKQQCEATTSTAQSGYKPKCKDV